MLLIFLVVSRLFVNAVESKNFIVYYKEDSVNAAKICNYLEHYKSKVLNIAGENPPKPFVFVEDIGTIANGYSDPLSRSISIFNYIPQPDFHFGTMKSWWRTVSIHEYTHHAQLSNIGFPASILRIIFGKIYLPNLLFLPGYMHEGIAVYNESNLESNDGRLNEGYFDAYLRVLNVRNKLRKGVFVKHDPADYPQGEIVYLMGSEFTEFIAKNYGEDKLNKYYTTIGKMPLTIPLIDIPALFTFKKPLSSIWEKWERDLKFHREFYLPPNFYVDRGYYIKYLRNFGGKLYYVKTNYKRLSWNYSYFESDLCFFDPQLLKIEKIYTGDISLPPVVRGSAIYFGTPNIQKGKSNISYYGLKFANAILKIDGSGKLTYLFEGRIRAFDVSNDTIFYITDEIEGSSLWEFKDGRHEKISEFKDLKIQQVLRDGENFYLLAHKELEENQIYRLSDGKLERVISLPFQIGYFDKKGEVLIFSGNYKEKWSLFSLNLETMKLKFFDDPILAYYPAFDSEKVYYVTLDFDGEYIKTASVSDFKDFELTLENYTQINDFEFTVTLEKTKNLSYLKELLYPDLILPLVSFNGDLGQNLYKAKLSFEGVQFQGHSPLNLVEYSAMVNFRELQNSQLITYYNGLPATSIAFSISGIRYYTGFAIAHILYVKNYGYMRQTNVYGELFPWAIRSSLSAVILGKISPDIYQTHVLGLHYENKKVITSLSHSTQIPIVRNLLLSGEFGVNYYHNSEKIEHAEDIRLTLPLLRVNWGNDAIIHFFYEKNFVTLELVNTSLDTTSSTGLLLTLDHLVSIFKGNLKLALRTGIMKKFGEPTPYIFVNFEPASFNFSQGVFKKRWILREIIGRTNLL